MTSVSGSIPFTAAANSGTSGLITVTPASGNTPGTLSVGLSQTVLATLAAGTYTGTVTVTSQSVSGSATINVSVTVQAAAPPAITSRQFRQQPGRGDRSRRDYFDLRDEHRTCDSARADANFRGDVSTNSAIRK